MSKVEQLWEIQSKALRNPLDIISASFADCGITEASLKYKADKAFESLLAKLGITLLITREYENMAIALCISNKRLVQSFMPLPHPSGITVDRKRNLVYIAATRNPNQLIEFRPTEGNKVLFPVRTKYYPGSYYFHDLALIKDELYANSVGMNGVIKVDWNRSSAEELMWFPKCTEDKKGNPITDANHIQLNSVAAGNSVQDSFFSASGDKIQKHKPGDMDYPVNKKGVIFSGKSRKPIAFGLTRPHSAKLYKGKLYINNSGYGEFGFIKDGKLNVLVRLPGWTRGLAIIEDVALIGVSRVLPKFRHYAPGIQTKTQLCGIYAFSLKRNELIGNISWEAGNQIFGIDFIENSVCSGFYYHDTKPDTEKEKNIFYRYR
jgi:uncharacterized protein (TIGR03032 family)